MTERLTYENGDWIQSAKAHGPHIEVVISSEDDPSRHCNIFLSHAQAVELATRILEDAALIPKADR